MKANTVNAANGLGGPRPDDPAWVGHLLWMYGLSSEQTGKELQALSKADCGPVTVAQALDAAREERNWMNHVIKCLSGAPAELSTDERVRLMFDDWQNVRAAFPVVLKKVNSSGLARLLSLDLSAVLPAGEDDGKAERKGE